MMNSRQMRRNPGGVWRKARTALAGTATALAATSGFADVSTNTAGPVQQGQTAGVNNPAETISLSGTTSFLTFIQSGAISLLSPNSGITLHNGTGGGPVAYYSGTSNVQSTQLASNNFLAPDVGLGATSIGTAPVTQKHSGLRVEWHRVGSTDGTIELVNDQIGYSGGITGTPLYTPGSRAPTSVNSIYVNTNRFQAGGTINGLALSGDNTYNTYSAANYELATGRNLLGGQNRVQFSVADAPVQIFSQAGTPSVFATAGVAGYGKGNPALAAPSTSGLGVVGSRQQLVDASVNNFETSKINPQTAANYAAGPWNSAGAGNLKAEKVYVDAVLFVANPGTGLNRLNKGDAQWLQTTSRLQNGATFNFTERDVNAGQREVPALNTGIDPSWAVGLNDGGDSTTNAAAQHSIGAGLRYSGKTTGGELVTTVEQGRASIGVASISEAKAALASAPIRALDVYFNGQTDPLSGGQTDSTQFVRANFDTIHSGDYQIFRNNHFVTVKSPDAAYGTANPNIKGDNQGDVRAFINNVTQTVSAYPNLSASIANPADGLLANGYALPGLLDKQRDYDGGTLYSQNLTAQQLALRDQIKAAYGFNFTTDGTNADNGSTIGSSATYGALGVSSAVNGAIPITSANYLLGNFNQDGRRDLSAVKESVNAALSLRHADVLAGGANSDIFGGAVNGSVVPSLSGTPGWAAGANKKGDLIVLGDYDGDGAFNGRDVLALARGAALADSTGADHLSSASGPTFADQVRNPNAVLRKNVALDYVRAQSANIADADQTFLRRTAESPQAQANDAANNYLNAFNKLDVDHNGKFDRNDGAIVDKFIGKDFKNLAQQVIATINDPYGYSNQYATAGAQVAFSLVDANLTDGKSVIDVTDFAQVRTALGAKLLDGDANFDGLVDFLDLAILAQHYNINDGTLRWGFGDFTGDGSVDFLDLAKLAQNYNVSAAGVSFQSDVAAAFARVPEPSSVATMLLAAVGGLMRPRRRRRRSACQ
ncbi:MAG: hypothetical protein JWN40_3236 [Phycisphaerales bacterium]|nr:hypothetical protein [Phycisphaerales bacterium]